MKIQNSKIISELQTLFKDDPELIKQCIEYFEWQYRLSYMYINSMDAFSLFSMMFYTNHIYSNVNINIENREK